MDKITIGEIRVRYGRRWIWRACPGCGKESWSQLRYGKPRNIRCQVCNGRYYRGKSHVQWKGGTTIDKEGYRRVRIYPGDPFFSMAFELGKGCFYVYEHRLVAAKKIGRPLFRYEPVHHLNGIKSDNRAENLEVLSSALEHLPDTELRRYVWQLEARVRKLETGCLECFAVSSRSS